VFAALRLPAVQAAREAARRITRGNNLKQCQTKLFPHGPRAIYCRTCIELIMLPQSVLRSCEEGLAQIPFEPGSRNRPASAGQEPAV
jgi:hypothetical protein